MLFKPEHKDMILKGTKTATRRAWKKPMVKVGGIYKAKLQMLSKDYFAKIKVTKIFEQSLVDMTYEDSKKEGYENFDDFIAIWKKINGEDSWNGDNVVTVIEFEVVESVQDKCVNCGERRDKHIDYFNTGKNNVCPGRKSMKFAQVPKRV